MSLPNHGVGFAPSKKTADGVEYSRVQHLGFRERAIATRRAPGQEPFVEIADINAHGKPSAIIIPLRRRGPVVEALALATSPHTPDGVRRTGALQMRDGSEWQVSVVRSPGVRGIEFQFQRDGKPLGRPRVIASDELVALGRACVALAAMG